MHILYRLIACLMGLCLYLALFQRQFGFALASKAAGQDQPCPWATLIRFPKHTLDFQNLQIEARNHVSQTAYDPDWGIGQYTTPTRKFWLKPDGKSQNGKELLAYVIAEQQWISSKAESYGVKPGDVVMDVGAHVGTFGDDALRRGAARVIMVEPDLLNLECIRRNFAMEIADGRVVVIPEGAWNTDGSLAFFVGVANSGTGSLVMNEKGSHTIQVPVHRIDSMLARAGIDRVDYLKMDIEGAEREALNGATGLLKKWKPRLFLDAYHLPDDDVVLPRVIKSANAGYQMFCPVCSPSRVENDSRIVPYAIFFY
jgi:FkbM family methyltransferase